MGWGMKFVIDIMVSNNININIIKITILSLLTGSTIISICSFGRFICVSIIEENISITLKKNFFKKIISLEINKIYNNQIISVFQKDITKIKSSVGRSLSVGIRSTIQLI